MSNDFQKMNREELEKALKEKREALLDNRFNLSGGRTKKANQNRVLKREIAQILALTNSAK